MAAEEPRFVVILEKKGRGRGALSALSRPWAVRTFRLFKQKLEYFDGEKLKGEINTKNSVSKEINSADADGKEFPFEMLTTDGEKLILNATGEEIRRRCIDLFNRSAADPNWDLLPTPPPEIKAYEDAASKAVVGAMAADAEKARIEAEQKRLEEERKGQVAEGASTILEEQAANAKLRAAKEAEEKQKEEQEKQIMESFKGMGAKMRFRAAMDKGIMREARIAAALMLQGAWRAKEARRKMVAKRAEKENLKMEGYAKKIQCRYRARLARKRMQAIKAEKLANQQKLAALKVQCAWRIFIARKRYRQKQDSKAVQEYNRQIHRFRGLIVAQSRLRGLLARQRINKLRIAYPSVMQVKIVSLDDQMSYSSSTSEPTALVSGMVLTMPADAPEILKASAEVSDEVLNTHGRLTSLYHCKPLSDAGAKTEVATATARNKLDYVVVTLVDTSSTAKGDLIGQAMVRLLNVPRLSYGDSVEVTVPLGKLKKSVTNATGEQLAFSRRATRGTVTLQLTRPMPAYTMCGWLWKVSESLLSNAWKKRWFNLVCGELTYCNTDLALDQTKNVVACATVTGITQVEHKGHANAIKIDFKRDGSDDFWYLDFDDDESRRVKDMWLRVLYRSCPQVADPTLTALGRERSGSAAARAAAARIGGGNGAAGVGAGTAAPKGKTPMSKRMSVFS